jgi:peptidoglycan hydrolase CwlO-like protein
MGTAVALAASLLCAFSARPPAATGDSLSQLQSELGANKAQASSLAGTVSALQAQVTKINSQVTLMQSRVSGVQSELNGDQTQLERDQAAARTEQARIATLQTRLRSAREALAAELVSRYESPRQSLVSLVVNASGFKQMLDQVQYLKNANAAEQEIIALTRSAKAQAVSAEQRLQTLEAGEERATSQKRTQLSALSGMETLLNSRRTALSHVEAAHAAALAATRARGTKLASEVAQAQAQELAAQRAAAAAAAAAAQAAANSGSSSATTYSSGSSSAAPSGGWAIPEEIVMCESGGQNLPPNGAGASGYYQIMPGTWKEFGGASAQAYQAPKSEQDAVASRIWDGGKGASNWSCAAIVGID